MIEFKVNSRSVAFDGDPGTPLLWVIRDHLQLTGTKYGCGAGECGSCTVHVNGRARKACMLPVRSVAGRAVTTIEGLATDDANLHPVQQAWLEHDVPQCGYCQAGQIMAAVDFLAQVFTSASVLISISCIEFLVLRRQSEPQPTDEDIDNNIDNLCRCGTYVRIRKAIHRAAELMAAGEKS